MNGTPWGALQRAPFGRPLSYRDDRMEKEFLEAGKIINTHGVRGEVKIDVWADSAEFLSGFDRLFIDGRPVKLLRARAHKGFLIASLDGVCDMDAANALRGKTVYISRDDAALPEGAFFIADLIGMTAKDEGGAELGKVTDVLSLPAGNVCVINGAREILVPIRPEFIIRRDEALGVVTVRLIEGM